MRKTKDRPPPKKQKTKEGEREGEGGFEVSSPRYKLLSRQQIYFDTQQMVRHPKLKNTVTGPRFMI